MKARHLSTYISNRASGKSGRILVFTGARQTGKTTLARHLFPDYEYITIEDPVTVGAFLKLTAAQWQSMYPQAILDEVQKEPVLIESIKAVYDQWQEPRYVLLGSSQLLLLSKVRESLAGRCVIVEMYPLTLPELKTNSIKEKVAYSLFQNFITDPERTPNILPSFLLDKEMAEKQQAWNHYLQFGGYPALTDTILSDEERYIWLQQYVRTYLERDVRDLASFRDLEPFVKLQRALAAQTGSVINASSLANHTGVTVKTAQRYIHYLEVSYQTITLPAWSRNETKRLMKAPKVHYLDNGVLQAVLQKRGGITGTEFESLVVAELYKQTNVLQMPAKFHHLRIQCGREIDLLLELGKGYIAFEIKMTDKVRKNDARHFAGLDEILDKPLIHCFILSNDLETQYFTSKVTAVHCALFLG
ncbi:MAG: AAA family ATPase [Burkholderiales bacterium]|nr:AAA family ATPase [Burkholderiales bacterium]